LYRYATEGYESLKEVGNRCSDNAFVEVGKRLHVAVDAAREEKGHAAQSSEDINDDEGHHFHIRAGLTRLNALVSLLPPPSAADTALKIHDVYEDLHGIIVDAANGLSCVGVRSIALAARAASLVLVHRMVELVDGGEELSDVEVDEHVTVRDAFISDAVMLAQGAVDMYPDSRVLPKVGLVKLHPVVHPWRLNAPGFIA
jgi:hypothetical protein